MTNRPYAQAAYAERRDIITCDRTSEICRQWLARTVYSCGAGRSVSMPCLSGGGSWWDSGSKQWRNQARENWELVYGRKYHLWPYMKSARCEDRLAAFPLTEVAPK